jgi:hypothetical protein
MNTRALIWLGVVFFVILEGCGKTDVKVSDLNKTAQDLKGQITDLKRTYGELASNVDRLSDSQKAVETQSGELTQIRETLKSSLEKKDGEYGNLLTSIEQLKNSQARLDSMVKHLATELSRKGPESTVAIAGLSDGPRSADRRLASTVSQGQRRMTARASAEVCEAVDVYMKRLNRVTRSSYGPAQDAQMDNALAELKLVVDKFPDPKESGTILALAEELKWYAYSASRSRTYIAAERGWGNLLDEQKKKLMLLCGRE